LDDLIIITESGDVVFEGVYGASGHSLELSAAGGKIIQQNKSKITADSLSVTAGDEVTLAQDNEIGNFSVISAGGNITLINNTALEISGINAGVNNVSITVKNGDVDISGGINGVKDLNFTVNGDINLSGNIAASSITIDTGSITGSGIAAASAGDIKINSSLAGINEVSLENFNALSGNIVVSTNTKDIVYYSSVRPANTSSGGTWAETLFAKANLTYNGSVELLTKNASGNIYLVDIDDSSQKTLNVNSGAGTGSNGYIEFFTTDINSYKYSGDNANHLNLLPGSGGVRIAGAIVDISVDFKINNNNKKLTLDGAAGSGIKAVNITLDEIAALNGQDLALTASEDINVNGAAGAAGSPLGNISAAGVNITFNSTINALNNIFLEAGSNITISGGASAYQLIAKAPDGTVSVNAVLISQSNAGFEGENAAVYIVADEFVVTAAPSPPYSIIPGGTGGQLCLELNKKWKDVDFVIDGCEEGDPLHTGLAVRWHQHLSVVIEGKILYSFTEDSNGNGKLDRIRVQANVALNGDFTGFNVSVTGYEIDRSKGNMTKGAGFDLVSAFTGMTPFDDDSFYIYLIEKPEIDGGNTPLWSILENTSLKDKGDTPALVGDPAADVNLKPVDTIPPRVEYALTLPGHPQTFMLATEPVVSSSGADISVSFGGLSVLGVNKVEPNGRGFLFNLSGPLKTEDLAKNIESQTLDNGYFRIDAVDQGLAAEDLSAGDPDLQPPKYPLNWGYTEYAKVYADGSMQDANGSNPVSGVFAPPNKILAPDMMRKLADNQGNLVTPNDAPVIRRATDVLVSMAPAGADSGNYFTWPVWARFKKSLNAPYANGNDAFWGRQPTDTGIIWQFDGTSFLEANFIDTNDGVELQARINDNLSEAPVLFWTTSDVPAGFRNPNEASEAKKTGGLWLPNALSPQLYNYVPVSDGINETKADSSSSKLFNYSIAANSLAVGSGDKFEFIFRLSDSSDMFIARLDIPRGAAIPDDWRALIRPFVFDIRNIRRQRGGVTVLNNVINSNNREIAYIRYHLARPGRVTVQIYTLDGTLVKSLRRNEQRDAGEWTDSWDGTNNGGRPVARGMYFVRVVGPDIDEIRKIMVVK